MIIKLLSDDLKTQAEAAKQSGVSREAVRKWLLAGEIKGYEVGGVVFVSLKETQERAKKKREKVNESENNG